MESENTDSIVIYPEFAQIDSTIHTRRVEIERNVIPDSISTFSQKDGYLGFTLEDKVDQIQEGAEVLVFDKLVGRQTSPQNYVKGLVKTLEPNYVDLILEPQTGFSKTVARVYNPGQIVLSNPQFGTSLVFGENTSFPVALSYLTPEISWKVIYRLRFMPDKSGLLSANIIIKNTGEPFYLKTHTKVVLMSGYRPKSLAWREPSRYLMSASESYRGAEETADKQYTRYNLDLSCLPQSQRLTLFQLEIANLNPIYSALIDSNGNDRGVKSLLRFKSNKHFPEGEVKIYDEAGIFLESSWMREFAMQEFAESKSIKSDIDLEMGVTSKIKIKDVSLIKEAPMLKIQKVNLIFTVVNTLPENNILELLHIPVNENIESVENGLIKGKLIKWVFEMKGSSQTQTQVSYKIRLDE